MNSASSHESALSDLFDLLERWKNLTFAEGSAIRMEDWPRLKAIQAKKEALQEEIVAAEDSVFDGDWLSPARKDAEKARLKEFAAELLELEEENKAVLGRLMAETDTQIKRENRNVRNLRNVQRTYGHGSRGASFWHSYS